VVRRWNHFRKCLVQFSRRLIRTLWQGKRFPSQKPSSASRTLYISILWNSTGTILRSEWITCRIILSCYIVTRMCAVDSATVNGRSRSRKIWNSSLCWTNRKNGKVTPHRTMIVQLETVVASNKTKLRLSQKLHKIVLKNCISTVFRNISCTTSLTISASFAASSMEALNSLKE